VELRNSGTDGNQKEQGRNSRKSGTATLIHEAFSSVFVVFLIS
jgi:hypothetical protein